MFTKSTSKRKVMTQIISVMICQCNVKVYAVPKTGEETITANSPRVVPYHHKLGSRTITSVNYLSGMYPNLFDRLGFLKGDYA